MTDITGWAWILGLVGLGFSLATYAWVRKQPAGNEIMRGLAEQIEDGAMAFLRREYTVLAGFVVVIAALLWLAIGQWTALSFVFGAVSSMVAGFIGMKAATKANVRTAEAARASGQGMALRMAFNGGAVMGLAVAALGLFGIGLIYFFGIHQLGYPVQEEILQFAEVISGYAMGASSIALFARVGGGIYTKAADVGADLVGKVEAGIPEDDPRNPATIADNVGDNVGDMAGMGADIFESYVGAVIATIAIGATSAFYANNRIEAVALPIITISVGLVASLIGILLMRVLEKSSPAAALRNVTFIAAAHLPGGHVLRRRRAGLRPPGRGHRPGLRGAGAVLGHRRGRRRRHRHRPGHRVLHGRRAGATHRAGLRDRPRHQHHRRPRRRDGVHRHPAAPHLPGDLRVLHLRRAVRHRHRGGGHARHGGRDHVGGRVRPDRRQRGRHRRDEPPGPRDPQASPTGWTRIGNTTAAIGKGFAIGSAALTALALFSAYASAVGLQRHRHRPGRPAWWSSGCFIGGIIPFFVGALTMTAVGRAAQGMVEEVRRQFREIPGLMEGTAKPDSARCVDISTRAALREMILPGLVAVVAPVVVGYFLGVEALGGLLAGATVTGVLMALFMANAGGAWDNAKKYIEGGAHGGKGSDPHKAAVVGDTVGDPFKDTSGRR